MQLDHLEWPFFEDSHRDLASKISRWSEAELSPSEHVDESAVRARCRELVTRLAAASWLSYVVPSDYGGRLATIDARSLCLVREHLAYHDALADFSFAMQGLGSAPISLFGTESQKKAYLPEVCSGDRIAAFAISETDAGSDVAAMRTQARVSAEGFILNGEKSWISNGGIADYYVVFARTESEDEYPGARGLSAFIVDATTSGLDASESISLSAPHPLARVRFRDCSVPSSALLGGRGDGFKIAMATLDLFRPSVGAAAVGMARRALAESAARANQRRLFGKRLAQLQLTQQKVAEMATWIDTSALLVYRAAWCKDVKKRRITREASMAKMVATESAQRVIDRAVQLFGAEGVVRDHVVERLYREIRALRIYEGATEIHQLIVGKQTLEQFEA